MRLGVGSLLCVLLSGCGLLLGGHAIDRSDPRFAACGGNADDVLAAFPMGAADYQRHFPEMGLSPELHVDEPAFAVVFAEGFQGPPTFGGPLVQDPRGEERAEPKPHFVCLYVGNPPTGVTNWYGEVDIAGMNP